MNSYAVARLTMSGQFTPKMPEQFKGLSVHFYLLKMNLEMKSQYITVNYRSLPVLKMWMSVGIVHRQFAVGQHRPLDSYY